MLLGLNNRVVEQNCNIKPYLNLEGFGFFLNRIPNFIFRSVFILHI